MKVHAVSHYQWKPCGLRLIAVLSYKVGKCLEKVKEDYE